MGCKTCGKNKHTKKHGCNYPAAVVTIENPNEPILFHKVVIPASMGDESQTPVTIGKYCNVLMVYEANGHSYLYSSDGIPTKLGFDAGSILLVDKLPKVSEASVGFLYITRDGNLAITDDNKNWIEISGTEGTKDFNKLINRPKYAGVEMTDSTDIPNFTGDIEMLGNQINETNVEVDNLNEAVSSLSSETDSLSSLLSQEAADRAAADAALSERISAEAEARAEADAGKVDKVDGKGLSTNDFTNEDKDKLDSAIQPENIDYTVVTDLSLAASASTTTVVMEGDKVNLKEGITSDFEIPLPVASATQAGVMNTATYQAIQDNTERIQAIEGGAVAINNIAASPSQSDLTTAWQGATGLTDLINGASILDVDNDKIWTYYTNTDTWYPADTTGSVTVSQFTNTEAGIIKGSTVDGQVHAEADGTGSVQGWDTVKADIANNAQAITTKVDAETGKGLSTNDFTDSLKTKLEGIESGAEVNDPLYSTTGVNTDGAMTQAATTNALNLKQDKLTSGIGIDSGDFTNNKVEIDHDVVMYETPGVAPSNVEFVGTANIHDAAVTSDKIDCVTLYDNPNGANGDFTLSESFMNFKFIEVYAGTGASIYCKFIPRGNGQGVRLQSIHRLSNSNTDNGMFINMVTLVFNGTQVTYERHGQMTIRPSNQAGTHAEWEASSNIGISKIVGYR